MGYECLICNDSLEEPAPMYEMAQKKGTQDAFYAVTPGENRVRKPPGKKPNIRDGTPTDIVTTQCGHMFHQLCVARWFKDKNTMACPVCRRTCQQSRVIRIFPKLMMDQSSMESGFNFQPQPPSPIVPKPAETSIPPRSTFSSQQSTSAFSIPESLASETATGKQNSNEPQISIATKEVMFNTVNLEHGLGPLGTSSGQPSTYIYGPSFMRHARGNDQDVEVVNINEEPVLYPLPQPHTGQPCNLPECQDFRIIHQTLIHDFEDIQCKYFEGLEELALKRGQMESYDEIVKCQADRITALEGERDSAMKQLTTQDTLSTTFNEQQMDIMNGQNGVKRRSMSRTCVSPPKRHRSEDNPSAGGSSMI